MTASASGEGAILRWAAGGPPPSDPEPRAEVLLEAVRAHRLAVRLERRFADEAPAWASPGLVKDVADLAAEARSRMRQLHAALREVMEIADPLLSKGMAYFLLLTDDLTVTRSDDLDLFSRDLPRLRDRLTALGYVVDPKDPPEPFGRTMLHEFAKLDRGDVQIDLHSRFPAWRYPPEVVSPQVTDPSSHGGRWRPPGEAVRGEISVPVLYANSERAEGVAVTGPEMTVLVSCCHMFANYLTEFPRPYGTMRFGELANVAAMLDRPGFRWDHFARLTAQCMAQDAVAFAFALLETCLGRRVPPPKDARRPGDPQPPRSLWFARGEGPLVSTAGAETADDLLVRQTTPSRLIDHLGAVAVLAAAEPRWHEPERAMIHGTLPLSFALSWDHDALTLAVRTPGPPAGGQLDLLLQAGDAIYEGVEHPRGELYVYDRIAERRTALPLEREGSEHRMPIPWSALGAHTPRDTSIPLLIGARTWPASGDLPLASAVLPVRLSRA